MSHPLFFIFYFGIKYAPKLLLCSSGFSLFFKFICFLDDKTEIEKELKKLKEELIKEKINRENMGKNIELKDNTKKEAICIANIIKINEFLKRLDNNRTLLRYAERCKFITEHNKDFEKWKNDYCRNKCCP